MLNISFPRENDNDSILNVEELANLLDELQAKQNGERGARCVRDVATYLRQGDIGAATRVERIEHDKMRQYPEIERIFDGTILNTVQDREMRRSIWGDEWRRDLRS